MSNNDDFRVEYATLEHSKRKAVIRAFIANADFYADGNLMGAWHPFPTTSKELKSTLSEIGVDGIKHSRYIVGDYDSSVSGLNERLPKNADINEINYLAVRLNEMQSDNIPIFEVVMEIGRHCGSLRDIINVTENLDCFDVQPAFTAKEYGEHLLEMDFDRCARRIKRLELSIDPSDRELADFIDHIQNHIDAESYGWDRAEKENGQFVTGGYLTESGEFVEVYDTHHDIPEFDRVLAFTGITRVMPPEKPSLLDRLSEAKASQTVMRKDSAPGKDGAPHSHEQEI